MPEYTLRTYQSPTRLVQRLGAIQELGSEASRLGMRRPLLVTDAGVKAAGLLEVALESLRRSDVEPVVFDKVRANPGVSLVDEGAAEYRAQGCDGLVAIGGGSSMDTAKGIGVGGAHNGSIVDYEWGHSPIESRIPPMIAVPTPAGTASEGTLWGVTTHPNRKIKFNTGPHRAVAGAGHGVQLRGRAGAVRAHGRGVRSRHQPRLDVGGGGDGGRVCASAHGGRGNPWLAGARLQRSRDPDARGQGLRRPADDRQPARRRRRRLPSDLPACL